jgi:hypothetical protein
MPFVKSKAEKETALTLLRPTPRKHASPTAPKSPAMSPEFPARTRASPTVHGRMHSPVVKGIKLLVKWNSPVLKLQLLDFRFHDQRSATYR